MEALIQEGYLERVPPSADLSEVRFVEAEEALDVARMAIARSPRTAYVDAYDAARLAIAAVLDRQGLRATSKGGHIALQDTIEYQTRAAGRNLIQEFSEMRRKRNEAEYRRESTRPVTAELASAACDKAAGILAMMRKFAPMVGPF